MRSGGTTLFREEKQSEDEFVTVSKEYLMELERKAKDSVRITPVAVYRCIGRRVLIYRGS